MKRCSKCGEEKESDAFYKDKRTTSGFYAACKNCHNLAKDSAWTPSKYRSDPNPGTVASMFMARILHNRKGESYKNIQVRVKHADLRALLEREWKSFMELHSAWKIAGFPRKLSPSIDRIDNKGHYEIGNIRFMTVSDNVRRNKGRVQSSEERSKRASIMKRDTNGKFIQ